MKELNFSTKEGQKIYDSILNSTTGRLWQVYDRYSEEKRKAYDHCWQLFLDSYDSHWFRICSHNPYTFTCGWFCKVNGEDVARYETATNSYIVWLDR